jgi:hypothetical protein
MGWPPFKISSTLFKQDCPQNLPHNLSFFFIFQARNIATEALKENIVIVIIASVNMATDHLAMVIVTKTLCTGYSF